MKFTKKAQGGLLIAAVVSVVAIVGLLIGSIAPTAQVTKGLVQSPMYRDFGVRSSVDQIGWDMGSVLGEELWTSNQANRECITECGNTCKTAYPATAGNIVNQCFQFCKSGCEKRMRELETTGGYYTP